MKNAILLSGGNGTRLQPLTHVVNKHLLGVDGKFIIDYPLNTLKQMGCENVTVILGGNHFSQVVDHLKDGQSHGMKFNYVYQGAAKGIAQAINLCQRHVADDDQFAVILGDNIFSQPIVWDEKHLDKSQIVLHFREEEEDLKRFGVASLNKDENIVKIEEKPKKLNNKYTNAAITGCYLFNSKFFEYFPKLKPSDRGEYEITDILRAYHDDGDLHPVFQTSFKESFWSDAGTHESLELVNNYFYNKKHRS